MSGGNRHSAGMKHTPILPGLLIGRVTFPRKLWSFSLRHPWLIVALAFLCLAALSVEARTLTLEPRGDLLSANDPLTVAEEHRREIFGPDFRVVAALFKPADQGGVLQISSLEALADLHHGWEKVSGVRRIASLVNSPVLVGSAEAAEGAPLWPELKPGAAETLRRRLEAAPIQSALFLSSSGTLIPLYLETEEGTSEPGLIEHLQRIAADVEKRHPGAGEVLVMGPAVVETGLLREVFDDLHGLVPVALAATLLVLLWVVRSVSLFLVVIIHSLGILVAVLGGMAACGLSVNLVSVLVPIIMIPIGAAPLLHLLVGLRAGTSDEIGGEERMRVLDAAYARLEGAMLGAGATTALGFLGFVISRIPSIRQFGLILSAGTVFALLVTFTLDASLLLLLGWKNQAGRFPGPVRVDLIGRWLLGTIRSPDLLRRRSRVAIVASSLLAAACLPALTALRIDDTWVRNFDPRSEVARDASRYESEFLGTNILSVVVEPDPSDPEARSNSLKLVTMLPVALYGVPGVRGTLTMSLLARSLDPAQGSIWQDWPAPTPDTMAAYHSEWKRRGVALPRAAMLANPDQSRFQVLVFIVNNHFWEVERTVSVVKAIAQGGAGRGVAVKLGGNLASNLRMVRLAILGQGWAVAALLVVMAALAIGYTRSFKSGVMIVGPMILGLLATYLTIVGLGIPYGIAVSMSAILMIGTAVEFAIHTRAGLLRNRNASRSCWIRDMTVVIKGILLNGGLRTVGFVVLALSHVPPNRNLGLLCSLVVCISTTLTLFLLPTTALVAGGRVTHTRARG